jgi:hypothetical protein
MTNNDYVCFSNFRKRRMAMDVNKTKSENKPRGENDKVADSANATIDTAADQGAKIADAARDGLNEIGDLQKRAAENTKQLMQQGVETISQQAREATDRLSRTLGYSGEDSERLARQSKRNMEAVTRCGTVLTQAFQDVSRGWFELSQNQWRRNLDGMNKLIQAKSVQEFTVIQSELARESLQHMVQDSRAIIETSVRAIDEASRTFSAMAQQGPPAVH